MNRIFFSCACIALVALTACGEQQAKIQRTSGFDALSAQDLDGDGFSLADDCDDANPDVHPGAKEVYYDGLDNDCDLTTIDADADGDGIGYLVDCDDSDGAVFFNTRLFTDEDGDGFAGTHATVCIDPKNPPEGSSATAEDCDDANAKAYPGAARHEASLCTIDADNDGYGDAAAAGGAQAGSDCLDTDPNVVETTSGYVDFDGDGYGGQTAAIFCGEPTIPVAITEESTDCDDDDYLIHPQAYDSPDDGVDGDCSGEDRNALIDGGLFVDGSASVCPGNGTTGTPYCSLDTAVAAATDGTVIYVAAGYPGATPLVINNSISVVGGYVPPNWTRAELETQIAGGTAPALLIEGVSRTIDVTLDGVSIRDFNNPLSSVFVGTGVKLHSTNASFYGVGVSTSVKGEGIALEVDNAGLVLTTSHIVGPSFNPSSSISNASIVVSFANDATRNTSKIIRSSIESGVFNPQATPRALNIAYDQVTIVDSEIRNGSGGDAGDTISVSSGGWLNLRDSDVFGSNESGVFNALYFGGQTGGKIERSRVVAGVGTNGAALFLGSDGGRLDVADSYFFAEVGSGPVLNFLAGSNIVTLVDSEIAGKGNGLVSGFYSERPVAVTNTTIRVTTTSATASNVIATWAENSGTAILDSCIVYAATAANSTQGVDLFRGNAQGEETCTTSVLVGE